MHSKGELAAYLITGLHVRVKSPSGIFSSVCSAQESWVLSLSLPHDTAAFKWFQIRWRPVVWGLGLQFVFALLVLRTVPGYEAFKWLGDRVQEFLDYTDAGAIFIFGETFTDHFFAMKASMIYELFNITRQVYTHIEQKATCMATNLGLSYAFIQFHYIVSWRMPSQWQVRAF
jgi:Na+ dependent nucleoside transporter N-terminus